MDWMSKIKSDMYIRRAVSVSYRAHMCVHPCRPVALSMERKSRAILRVTKILPVLGTLICHQTDRRRRTRRTYSFPGRKNLDVRGKLRLVPRRESHRVEAEAARGEGGGKE